ncbi:MAG: peptidylprolyl isomerase [Eubacteriales bacterium]
MNRKKLLITLIMTLSLVLLISGCGNPKDKVLYKINDKSITAYDLSQYLPIFGKTVGVDISTVTDKAQLAEMQKSALDDLVSLEVIKQYYAAKGKDVIPATKDADLKAFMTQIKADAATVKFITDEKITDEYLQTFFLNRYYTSAFFAEVSAEIKDPNADAQKYYDSHKSEFTEEQVRASHILVKTKPEAEAILTELKNGGDFAAIAKAKSIDTTSGVNGGDLGYFNKTAMVAPFAEAAFATPVGQLSAIVQSDFGFHIIKVVDKKTVTTAFKDAQQNILYKLFDEAYKAKIETIKKTMKVVAY